MLRAESFAKPASLRQFSKAFCDIDDTLIGLHVLIMSRTFLE